MRGIISPFVVVALLVITLAAYVEYLKMKSVEDNVNNEIKLDVKLHRDKLKKISQIAEFKHEIYSCAKFYNCSNLTSFLINVSDCSGTYVYFNGYFYSYYNNHKVYLNPKYLGCDTWIG